MNKRVLLACPTHECKAYAFDRWWTRVQEMTYPRDVFVVDNSPTPTNTNRMLAAGVPTVVWDEKSAPDIHSMLRVTQSMEMIRQHFLAGPWDYWFNLEADIIPPVDVLKRMLELGGDADWISHAYPMRGGEHDDQQGIGLSLLSRRMMCDPISSFTAIGDNSPDGGLWARVRPTRRFKTMELWGYFPVEHLKEPE